MHTSKTTKKKTIPHVFSHREKGNSPKPIVLELREKLGITQEELCHAIGVKQPEISLYEKAQPEGSLVPPWRLKHLKRFCEEKGIRVSWEDLLRDHFLVESKVGRKPKCKK